jgi:hypothetical protein
LRNLFKGLLLLLVRLFLLQDPSLAARGRAQQLQHHLQQGASQVRMPLCLALLLFRGRGDVATNSMHKSDL